MSDTEADFEHYHLQYINQLGSEGYDRCYHKVLPRKSAMWLVGRMKYQVCSTIKQTNQNSHLSHIASLIEQHREIR